MSYVKSKTLTVVAVAFAAATIAVSRGPGNAGATTAPRHHVVEIRGFKFSPSALTIRAGDSVEWINRDIVPHTATGNINAWDTKKLGKGQSSRITFAVAGREDYICRFHQTMRGKIIITAK